MKITSAETAILIKYPQFVKDLCKSGFTMKEEWNNFDKEALRIIINLNYECSLLSTKINIPLHNENDYEKMHMVIGLCGECGEIIDSLKKTIIYRKEYDYENIKEELGDLMFYYTRLVSLIGSDIISNIFDGITKFARLFNLTTDEIIIANYTKLSTRYGNEYSDKAAIERKDKQ